MDLDAADEIRRQDSQRLAKTPPNQRDSYRPQLSMEDRGWRRSGSLRAVKRLDVGVKRASALHLPGARRELHTAKEIDVGQEPLFNDFESVPDPVRNEYRSGDFVEERLRDGASSSCGIVLLPLDSPIAPPMLRRTLTVLTQSGRIVTSKPADITFHIPDFVRTQMADSKGTVVEEAMPTSDELEDWFDAASVLGENTHVLKDFASRTLSLGVKNPSEQSASRGLQASEDPGAANRLQARLKLSSAMRVCLRDKDHKLDVYRRRWLALKSNEAFWATREEIDTTSVASLLEQTQGRPPSSSALLTTHLLLMAEGDLLLADRQPNHPIERFHVRSARERATLATVRDWIALERSGQASPVRDFARKARPMLQQRNGASSQRPSWTEDDITILSLLLDCLAYSRMTQGDPFGASVAYILKSLETPLVRPPGTLSAAERDAFGQWEAGTTDFFHRALVRILSSLKVLDRTHTDWSLADQRSRDCIERMLLAGTGSLGQQQQQQQPPDIINLESSHDHLDMSIDHDAALRKPFEGTVYVIDDPTAYELDDGIAIESVQGNEGLHWIHVHIADPTSIVLPTDPLAQRARECSTSLYLPSGKLSMLPDSIPGIAMKEGSPASAQSRAMTFSALVDSDGLVQDFDVSLRTITAPRVTTYDAVNTILASAKGPDAAPLAKMRQVATQLRDRRARDGGFTATSASCSVEMYDGKTGEPYKVPFVLPSTMALDKSGVASSIAQGTLLDADQVSDPHFSLWWFPMDAGMSAQNMVAEFMIMAGRVAAAYTAKVNSAGSKTGKPLAPITLAYRSQTLSADSAKNLRRVIDAVKDENASLAYRTLVQAGLSIPAGDVSMVPSPHFALGIRAGKVKLPRDLIDGHGYSRVTSPLRRYSDMLLHWQIKAAMYRQVGNMEAFSQRYFDPTKMTELASQSSRRDAAAKAISLLNHKYWTLRALRQIFERAQGLVGGSEKNVSLAKQSAIPPGATPIDEAFVKSPLLAYITDSELRHEPISGTAFVRVRLDALGLDADCHWPSTLSKEDLTASLRLIGEEKEDMEEGPLGRARKIAASMMLASAPEPISGRMLAVRIRHVRENPHGGTLRVEVAKGE